MKQTTIKKLKNIAAVLLGNMIYALGVAMFLLPANLITGGTTGLSLLFEHFFSIPISSFILVFNIFMFFLGAWILGKKFAFTTLLSTFCYPVFLGFFQRIPALSSLTDNVALSTVFAGLMIGLAIGIVIKAGASTGGMDIPPLILNKKLGLPVSATMYAFDFAILLSQLLFADKEMILYGILLVLTYTIVLDKVLLFGTSKTQVKIVSRQYEEITSKIIHTMDRSATLLLSETGYSRADTKTVMTVISNRELPKLNEIVTAIDPDAFMVVHQVTEVRGRGFTLEKLYR